MPQLKILIFPTEKKIKRKINPNLMGVTTLMMSTRVSDLNPSHIPRKNTGRPLPVPGMDSPRNAHLQETVDTNITVAMG